MTPPKAGSDRLAYLSLSDAPPSAAEAPVRRPGPLRVGLIRNARSHRNKGLPAEPAASAHVPEAVSLVMPGSLAELDAALHRFAADEIDVLAIDGGDGTIRDVLTCGAPVFGERWPRLLLIPKGKTNALALDVGVPGKWQLADGLRALRSGRTVTRRPIVIKRTDDHARADGTGNDTEALWGFIFGAGAFNAAIETGQVAHRFGAFQDFAVTCTAALGVIQALFGFGSTPWRHAARMRIAGMGGAELPHSSRGPDDERYLALFSTLRRFPAGLAPFSPADSDIRFLLLDAPLRRVTVRLPAILWGADRPFYPEIGIHRGMGEAFDIALDEGFILDGEAFDPGRISLRQGPELHFIVA